MIKYSWNYGGHDYVVADFNSAPQPRRRIMMGHSIKRLVECFVVWKVSDIKQDEIKDNPPDCVIMQAFGQEERLVPLGAGLYTSEIVPGCPNEEIANVLAFSAKGSRYRANGFPPVLAQWEFTETHAVKRGKLTVELSLGSRGDYFTTREVLAQAKQYMDKKGWGKAVIVAHPWHLVRCIWIAKNLGIETVHDQLLVQDLNYDANTWNKNVQVPDKQRQTISLAHWLWYEIRARTYFWLKGWI